MKKTIISIIIFFAVSLSIAQQQRWVNDYTFNGYDVTQIQFLNPDVGYVSLQSGNQVLIEKTADKGRTWNWLCTFNKEPGYNEGTFFLFTDELHGYRAYPYHDFYSVRTNLNRTTDGGQTWSNNLISYFAGLGEQPVIMFTGSTGYLFVVRKDDAFYSATTRVLRTYDGFNTFVVIYDEAPPSQYRFRMRDVVLGPSGNVVGVGYGENQIYWNTDYYQLWFDGQNFTLNYGQNQTYLRFLYGAYVSPGLRYLGVQGDNNNYPGTRFYNGLGYQYGMLIDQNTDQNNVGGLSFSDGYKGFTTIENKVYITTNSGNNWTNEWTFGNNVYSALGHHRVKSFDDVCYASESGGRFDTRKIYCNFNTNFDWQGGTQGSIALDGENFSTPGQHYFKGGTCSLAATPYFTSGNDTIQRFYYWGGNLNGSMTSTNSGQFLISDNLNINADYKTRLKSTVPEALKYATQTKALKDTNGVINVLYESMGGGLFYTRTRKSDAHFKAEEFVSPENYPTWGNKNFMLSEIKPLNPGSSIIDGEKNLYAVWERREGNNIKIIQAGRNIVSPYFYWANSILFTVNNAPQNFETFPKIFVAAHPFNNNELKIVTYLKPDGSNKKIVGRVTTTNNVTQEFDITTAGNISEYSVAEVYPATTGYYIFNLHIVYRNNQTVYYKNVKIGQMSAWQGTYPYYEVISLDEPVSYDDSQNRASLDIGVKNISSSGMNLQPVISYQGRKNVRILVRDGDGSPTELQGYYYPIYVRERVNQGWSPSIITYNTTINTVQQTPSIIASDLKNSCILSYDRGSAHLKVVPRWLGFPANTYICSPNQFIGTDARLLKGSLLNTLSYTDTTMTLSQSGSVYSIDRQRFSVTNEQSTNDGSTFDGVTGIVTDDNIKYSFNLGSIMINSNLIGFSSDIDTTIGDGGELNENLTSLPFLLSDNDTLIIGRNAFYLNEGGGNFSEVQYAVYLTNNSTGENFIELARDTVHAGDSINVEFLEGYVIQNIPGGSDSFYVQMEIDTVWLGGGDGFGMNNISSAGGEGDAPAPKKMIFWKNAKPVTNNLPTIFNLYQNYPNPFNPITKIKYDLPKNTNVIVRIYDIIGREVTTLVNNEFRNAGRYEVNWNATNYASGVYFYRIEAGEYVSTKKMVLVK